MIRLSSAIFVSLVLMVDCAEPRRSEPMTPASGASDEQAVVDAATLAVYSMRASGRFPSFDHLTYWSRAVLIFPDLLEAELRLGGEGGNGVLLMHGEDGSWGPPAFYGIGAGTAGLRLGRERATVVLFLMNDRTLTSVIDRRFTIGVDASLAAGTLGKSGRARAAPVAGDVLQPAETGGLFAQSALDGAIIGARPRANERYYGPGATTSAIVIERRFDHVGTRALRDALAAAER